LIYRIKKKYEIGTFNITKTHKKHIQYCDCDVECFLKYFSFKNFYFIFDNNTVKLLKKTVNNFIYFVKINILLKLSRKLTPKHARNCHELRWCYHWLVVLILSLQRRLKQRTIDKIRIRAWFSTHKTLVKIECNFLHEPTTNRHVVLKHGFRSSSLSCFLQYLVAVASPRSLKVRDHAQLKVTESLVLPWKFTF